MTAVLDRPVRGLGPHLCQFCATPECLGHAPQCVDAIWCSTCEKPSLVLGDELEECCYCETVHAIYAYCSACGHELDDVDLCDGLLGGNPGAARP